MNRSIKACFILVAISITIMFSASLCFGAVTYVKSTGNDGNNGSSWAQAKQHVQAGIGAASSGG